MTTPKHECHSPGKFQVPDTNHGGTPIPSKKKKSLRNQGGTKLDEQSLQLPATCSHCLGGTQRTRSHPSAGPCSKARPVIVQNYNLPPHSSEAAREEAPPSAFVSACLCTHPGAWLQRL